MTGYEHEIKGTVIVNASDPGVECQARYMVCKIVDGEVWYYVSFNELEHAKEAIAGGTYYPTFIIDRGEP